MAGCPPKGMQRLMTGLALSSPQTSCLLFQRQFVQSFMRAGIK